MLFIQEFVKQKVKQLTAHKGYQLHFKHLVLLPNETMIIQAGTDVYLLTDIVDDVRLESDTGLFDWASGQSNEQVYEHRGVLHIENLSNQPNHIPFIQFTTRIENKHHHHEKENRTV